MSLLVALLYVAATETVLRLKGIKPTAVDDVGLWIRERARAARLGNRAIVLIGASRMQTDIDLDVLRDRTHLEPVQLAIDASSFLPVLEGLAADENVTGTVIVSYQTASLAISRQPDVAREYERTYEQTRETWNRLTYQAAEPVLTDIYRNRLRNYADGTRPLTALLTRVLPREVQPQAAIVLSDRSRLADYSAVDVTYTYYTRVLRELGTDTTFDEGTSYAAIDATLKSQIEVLPPTPPESFRTNAKLAAAYASRIEARGGHVIFVEMPTSGLVTLLEDRRYPREIFWNEFVLLTHATTLNFKDVESLKSFPVPDGSHMDYHTRSAFTRALVDAIEQKKGSNAGRNDSTLNANPT